MEEWVMENTERIQALRVMAENKMRQGSKDRKEKLDLKSKDRTFKVGDSVLFRTPGLETKLAAKWEGPYKVVKVLGSVTYGIDVGLKRFKTVHVKFLKEFIQKREIKRVTTVVEDIKGDVLEVDNYNKVEVLGGSADQGVVEGMSDILAEFKEVFTEVSGLIKSLTFSIDTGDSSSVSQRSYNTPVTLKEGVDCEIDWLIERGYIRESNSPWASLIVVVKKPNGRVRLCVYYKRVNSLTKPLPFYMPCVDEVLEAVGRSVFILKMDLSKGYYQVPMDPADIEKTAFVCSQGKFEFLWMPFGLMNTPSVFQTLMAGTVRTSLVHIWTTSSFLAQTGSLIKFIFERCCSVLWRLG